MKVSSYLQKGLKEKNTFTNVTRMTILKRITFTISLYKN